MYNARRGCRPPLPLHVGVGSWTLTKTRRLQHLHAELMQLRRPFAWEGDPGAKVFHELCLEVEGAAGGTLPALLLSHVVETLATAEETPFHLSEIAGVVVLDTAPDFSEREQDLLLAISSFCPVHQLLNPGSFRLGFHGAYLVDESPCTKENLPLGFHLTNPGLLLRTAGRPMSVCEPKHRSHASRSTNAPMP